MASRELKVAPKTNMLPPPAAEPDDIWQGWFVYDTPTGGVEITLRTAGFNWALVWIGVAVAAMETMVTILSVPVASSSDYHYSQGGTIIAILIGLSLVNLVLGAVAFAVLPESLRYVFQLQAVEIRPDGLTINRCHFFYRNEVFTLGVRHKGGLEPYEYALQGIIGTRDMTLIGGIDKPTSELLTSTLEQAKRQVWRAIPYDI